MKKPEKARHRKDGECDCKYMEDEAPCEIKMEARNQAIDEYERYLPSAEEIQDIIYKHCKKVKINSTEWVRIQIAKVIAKRIGTNKEVGNENYNS